MLFAPKSPVKALLPVRWAPLRPHPEQSRLWRSTERNILVCAGRGSGKTELARRRIVRALREQKPWPDPRYFYGMPTYNQCRRVAREHILSLIPRNWLTQLPGTSQMEFKTVFGSWLFLVGMDNPARVEGDQYDGGVLDECSDQRPGVYNLTLRPAFTHRQGWLWRIGVPKRRGPGAPEFRRAFEKAGDAAFTWPSWDILPAAEIEKLQQELDEKDFNEQIGGRWEDAGGAAYYAFSREHNISDGVVYNPSDIIYVGMDFNVNPMAWVIGHKVRTSSGLWQLRIFDELWIRNTNTQRSLDELWRRYSSHTAGWVFTGDASSNNRHTAASQTDYAQLSHDRRFAARIRWEKKNPSVRDRVAAVNTVCCNKAGERKLLISPKCQHLIEDLTSRSLDDYGNPMPATPAQAFDSGHATDALGYLVWQYFPLRGYMPEGERLVIVR